MVEVQAVSLLIFDHGLLNIIGPAVGLHDIAESLRKIPEIQCAGIFLTISSAVSSGSPSDIFAAAAMIRSSAFSEVSRRASSSSLLLPFSSRIPPVFTESIPDSENNVILPHTGRGDGGTEKLRGILPERVFVVGNQKRTVKQHERSRSFSKTGQRGLGKKQRQMGNPVLPLKQGRTGFFGLSERNLQILHKKYGKIRAIYFAKTREKLTVF